jgi:hypothetical protein
MAFRHSSFINHHFRVVAVRKDRRTVRRAFRNCNRRCLRGRRRGPSDFNQALTAYRRALRAHRRLARLAPEFFDEAVIQREAENRAERRRWMATWEPALAKAYGQKARAPDHDAEEKPPLPPPRIQRKVDHLLAELQLWMNAGHLAMRRHRRQHPHGLLSLTQMARLLEVGFALGRMACGMDSPNELPEKITYDDEWPDLERAYGHLSPGPKSDAAADSKSAPVPLADATKMEIVPPTPTPPAPQPAGTLCPAVESAPASPPPVPAEPPPRCDAWSRWARQLRRRKF